jgi:hypothetical protein
MILALLACTPKDSFDGAFTLTDANNYHYTSSLDITEQEVELGSDVSVDWSQLHTDILGHSLDPAADIDYVWLLSFPYLSHEELAAKLVEEDLDQEDVQVFATYDNREAETTNATLSQFKVLTNPFLPDQYFTSETSTWLLRFTTGDLMDADNRMLQYLVPTQTSHNTSVTVTDASTTLNFDVDLQSLDSFDITEQDAYTVDWSALTTHANGTDLQLDDLDTLMLARFDDKTLDDLEADFIDVETIADATYTADVYGKHSFDLAETKDADGAAFPGFGDGTLWLLALRCSTCLNPAPPFLTVVNVGGT